MTTQQNQKFFTYGKVIYLADHPQDKKKLFSVFYKVQVTTDNFSWALLCKHTK